MAEPRTVWLDVDGTAETGEPAFFPESLANMSLPPLNRGYNYNFPLFDALESAPDVDATAIWLFTAYDAKGGGNTLGVLRCELVDWIRADRPRLGIAGVATVIDPAFGYGPGAYYRSVIEPTERAVLQKLSLSPNSDAVCLAANDEIHTLSPADWTTVVTKTYNEVLKNEQALVEIFLGQSSRQEAWTSGNQADMPKMDKAKLARLCLGAPALAQTASIEKVGGSQRGPARRVLFLDDRKDYIAQVDAVCQELGCDCRCVHVTPDMNTKGAFLQKISPPSPSSLGCVVM